MKTNLQHTMLFNPLIIIVGSFLFVIIPFSIWANYTKIDQISHAEGKVITSSKTQEIQSAIDGVVEDILVKEGDKVTKGQCLINLEKSQNKAGFESSYAKVAALEATIARLNAELYGVPLSFPSIAKKYPEFIETQTQLYNKRQKAVQDEVNVLNKSISYAKKELNLIYPLLATGDVGSTEVLRLQTQISDKEGEIINKKNKYFQDAQSDMTKAEEDLSTKEQELEDRKVTLERTRIDAPMNAVVKNIILTTMGAKVKPGDVILELVPFGDELLLEAKLDPSDISFVRTGQKAAVKLDAYDYSIYGIFHGIVKYISPDTIMEKTAQGEKYYFKVLISVNKKELLAKNGKKIELTPGMTAQVDIVTGNRSVMTYLLKPLTKTLSQSFNER